MFCVCVIFFSESGLDAVLVGLGGGGLPSFISRHLEKVCYIFFNLHN